MQHEIPFKLIFWSNYHLSNFIWKSLTPNKIFEQKSKYWNSIRVFSFFISFFCWNKINKKSLLKEDTRKNKNCKVNHILNWSSHQRYSLRKSVLRNFVNSLENMCQSLFFKLLLKDSCKDIYFRNFRFHLLCFTILSDVMLKRSKFLCLSEGFGKKCKHKELALNFIQKQYFS